MITRPERDRVLKNEYSSVLDKVTQAIKKLRLIEDGDSILAAVSGGKDSLSMLHFLDYLRSNEIFDFRLIACNVDLGFTCANREELKKHFEAFGIEYYFTTNDIMKGKSRKDIGCFWCAWSRRKALFKAANEKECNKVSLGHHLDDIIHTTMLNMLFHGEISTSPPKLEFLKASVTLIRPLCHVKEDETKGLAKMLKLPVPHCNCPRKPGSKRALMKEISDPIFDQFPEARDNFLKALTDAKKESVANG
ncbi:MAG: tRNA 2-thiocytidine biosynthesis protein TtcA [Candidatus Omnitrophica bacterium]|nr:tRNA 2-thiocytidine biosynthesis protein TtcA [Candidatus Omnitrophota bacterium]